MRPYSLPARFALLTLTAALAACGGGGSGSSGNNQPQQDNGGVQQDTRPDTFAFSAVNDADLDTAYTADAITVSGINASTNVSISGGEYSVNNGSYSSDAATLENGDSVAVRVTSSTAYSTEVAATLTIGGVSADYTVTTMAEPVEPEPPAESAIKVDFNLNMRHSVGGESEFDRRKFITVHASNTENDWFDENAQSSGAGALNDDSNLMTNFLEGYDVYFGRDTGNMKWQLSQLPEDGSRPGFIDVDSAITNGGGMRWNYSKDTSPKGELIRKHGHRATDLVVGGQDHPYWPDGQDTGMGWSFSTTDTDAEPFGTAVGHYMANYLYEYFNRGENDEFGQPKPVYLEVVNEPLYDLVDYPSAGKTATTAEKVFKFHNAVANEVRAYRDAWNLASHENVLIGGYTVAFPDFEKDNFNRWEERDKLFIDIAGNNMDFLSVHFYDFPAFQGTRQLRRGSNVEATFDMLEQYSLMATGARMPFMVSEIGATVHSMMNDAWSPQRDSFKLRALNGLTMNMLERPDQILKSIPFVTIKAEWGRDPETGMPYTNRLMRQKSEGDGETGDAWVYTEFVKFYQLWSDVQGTRVDSWASDLDVQVNAYVDGNTAYLVVNNLEQEASVLDLATLGIAGNSFESATIKQLHYDDSGKPVLDETSATELPQTFTLNAEATAILQLTFTDAITIDNDNMETKYYAETYKQAITAGEKISFVINGVTLGDNGEAILRLGVGRDHDKSLTPSVTINGNTLSVPEDYQGYDQYYGGKGRAQFFGVIEIPVDHSYLSENNVIEIAFDDDGGFVSTVTAQVSNTSVPLGRGARG
ncbi:agarase [Microbulbifer agarilyticus]|uniref:Agarase n=1 Tax=Microbulbifer agarilyticus TaxID=260552 RepID=A0A1Q2M3I9_9GAMM|nr:agarase [Microbulbifer agarilyticus]AQQ67219.1 agarase [Microbulbifer agarilyticus]